MFSLTEGRKIYLIDDSIKNSINPTPESARYEFGKYLMYKLDCLGILDPIINQVVSDSLNVGDESFIRIQLIQSYFIIYNMLYNLRHIIYFAIQGLSFSF